MRINFLILIFVSLMVLASLLWLEGFWVGLSFVIIGFLLVITVFYTDAALLFFLGARGIKRADEAKFHLASAQEAYKLALPVPRLYFYNGSFDRAFVFEARGDISLVLSKDLLDNCTSEEIAAICFSLLLQVKKNLVKKRNKTIFIMTFIAWISNGLIEMIGQLLKIKYVRLSLNWLSNFLLKPWLDFFYKISLGERYFLQIKKALMDYPIEAEMLKKVAGKINRPDEIDSFSSRKLLEYSAIGKNRHFQRIINIELLPHEWDYIFKP
jgi:hypothetical protein